ncbi:MULTISPECIES: CitMHS family transporter [Paenibacillus]|uniref:CitMHS family transporter n=1 Tax=Paenibacillus TaxID=44249 RepID=UPI0022B929F9|nr:CitMHS family transporter [Paenibacillus caseinilyticus]MCZ8520814.1 CitMHS family transporter [Paenibacillus caseinilyticus]
MLALLGFGMITVFMYLIMTKRISPLTALILVPAAFALIGGFHAELGSMMLTGVKTIAPTGVMLLFGILYFGVMIDAGLFDPLVNKTLQLVKGDPVKIVVGTALLSLFVSLDGDGSTTYMIVAASMLPLYQRLGMNPLILAAVTMLGSGVMNITPWGGPTARVMSALHLDASEVFTPLIPGMVAGGVWVVFAAYLLGRRERKRLGLEGAMRHPEQEAAIAGLAASEEVLEYKRPNRLWFNFLLTAALMAGLILNVVPLSILFMLALAVALIVNYPKLQDQKERLEAHAGNALAVAGMVFAAGIFTGILSGTQMVDAMAQTMVSLIPDALGPHLPVIAALASMPFTFFMSNDAYYFGILPIITEAAAAYGISPAEMARASLLGQPVHLLSPLVPSTYLLVGLAGVDFGDHQRFTLKWAVGTTLVMLAAALLLGVIVF